MIKIRDGYYQDNLVNYECLDCGKQFIVGEESLEECDAESPNCPYCGGQYVMKKSWTDDEMLEEMSLGCIGIYLEKEEPASPLKRMECIDGVWEI